METVQLTKAERQAHDRLFLTEILQGGRIRPSIFIYDIKMPCELFEEMKDFEIIDINQLTSRKGDRNGHNALPIAFFEFRNDKVIVSFCHVWTREDFKSIVERYLIIKYVGKYPLECNWPSKMNFDKIKIEPIVNESHDDNRFETVGEKGLNRRY